MRDPARCHTWCTAHAPDVQYCSTTIPTTGIDGVEIDVYDGSAGVQVEVSGSFPLDGAALVVAALNALGAALTEVPLAG